MATSDSAILAAASKMEPIRQLRFPFQLHDMLRDATKNGFDDVVSWLPCGTAFKVFDQQLFEDFIMPGYFAMSKYKSFLRQLNLYQFRRLQPGSYCHDSFGRDRRHDCQSIHRRKKNGNVDFPDVATTVNQLAGTTTSLKKSSTSNVGLLPSNASISANASGGRPQFDACNASLSGATLTLSVAQSTKQQPQKEKPRAVGMKSGRSIRPRGQGEVTTFEAVGGNSWFRDHDTLLLDYAYQIVGVPLAERCSFSEKEIKDELKTTFPKRPSSRR